MFKRIRQAAEEASHQFQINWEKFEDGSESPAQFVDTLEHSTQVIPSLERLYGELRRAKPLIKDEGGYIWDEEELQNYRRIVEDELYACYQIKAILDRYLAVENVLNKPPLDK